MQRLVKKRAADPIKQYSSTPRIGRIIITVIAMILMVIGLSSCQQEADISYESTEEVVIPAVFLVNPETGASFQKELIEQFNEENKGKYRVEVEWISDTAEGYRTQIKRLNALDELPAILTDVGFDPDFYRLLADKKRLVDLRPYLKEPEWNGLLEEKILKKCQEADGTLYQMPLTSSIYSYAGFYYNKELFAKAGIKEFPQTWPALIRCLELLQENNITPLALHGGSSYWCPLLIATNYMAIDTEGYQFLERTFPASYNNHSVKKMLAMLKTLYQYSDEDALTIDYDDAWKRFLDGEEAIFATGGWILTDIPEDIQKHTGFAPFPGNLLMMEPNMSSWAVAAGFDSKVTEGAVKLLALRAKLDQEAGDKVKRAGNNTNLVEEYLKAIRQVDKITANYQLKWESTIQNEVMVNHLPEYVEGRISQRQLIQSLDQAVLELEEEK